MIRKFKVRFAVSLYTVAALSTRETVTHPEAQEETPSLFAKEMARFAAQEVIAFEKALGEVDRLFAKVLAGGRSVDYSAPVVGDEARHFRWMLAADLPALAKRKRGQALKDLWDLLHVLESSSCFRVRQIVLGAQAGTLHGAYQAIEGAAGIYGVDLQGDRTGQGAGASGTAGGDHRTRRNGRSERDPSGSGRGGSRKQAPPSDDPARGAHQGIPLSDAERYFVVQAVTLGGFVFPCPGADLDAAYKRLVLALHPDRNPEDVNANAKLGLVNAGYKTLKTRVSN